MTKPERQTDKRALGGLPVPLFYWIATDLRERIMSGEWPAGGRLPTEEKLSSQYGVSRQTIRKAKDHLGRDGLIANLRGSGCYVNPPERWISRPPTVENLREFFTMALSTSFQIHYYGMVTNTQDVSCRLQNDEDRFVFQIRGLRSLKGRPLSYVVYHIPYQFGRRIPMEELDENAFIPQFEALAGIKAVEGVQSISLGRSDRNAAEHLGVNPGDPVLLVETIYTDDQGRPIEFVRSQYWEGLPYSIRVRRD